jgi:anhydro-N-acetylmuramic acid kinase
MKKLAVGLMSGTSLDGIDLVLVNIENFDLNTKVEVLYSDTILFDENIKHKIIQAMDEKVSNNALLCSLNVELGYVFGYAVLNFLEKNHINIQDVSFISSHGQTIYHIPTDDKDYKRSSLQLGDGSIIAEVCHTTVVSNFRLADIAAGGQGAPLVPYADYLLFSHKHFNRVIHNIGGIANATILSSSIKLNDVVAYDSGPGNMMIDEACQKLYGLDYDKNGDIAQSGQCIDSLYNELMHHPYYQLMPPKTSGREMFGKQYILPIIDKYIQYKKEDIIHTISLVTAHTIADSYKHYHIDEVFLCGGGAYNTFIKNEISKRLKYIPVLTLESLRYSSDYKEALAFVILGNQTLNHRPSNVIGATGATHRKILGQINYND